VYNFVGSLTPVLIKISWALYLRNKSNWSAKLPQFSRKSWHQVTAILLKFAKNSQNYWPFFTRDCYFVKNKRAITNGLQIWGAFSSTVPFGCTIGLNSVPDIIYLNCIFIKNIPSIFIRAKGREYVFTGVGLSVCVCLSVTTITKKIVDEFVPNFMERFLGG